MLKLAGKPIATLRKTALLRNHQTVKLVTYTCSCIKVSHSSAMTSSSTF